MSPSRVFGATSVLSRHAVLRWGVAIALIAVAAVAGARFTQAVAKGPKGPKGPEPIAAQSAGCCFCFDCDDEAPFCTDFMSSSSNCMTVCESAGCTAHTFSQVDTCGGGCGDMTPYSSPTPTPSPTEVTGTPTQTPTDTATPTVTLTPTPIGFCCACNGGDFCQDQSESGCLARNATPGQNCTPFPNQACDRGIACTAYTATPTATRTRVDTATRTATNTLTPSPTATATLGTFNIDPYNCYRAKGASEAKGHTFTVEDSYGRRTKTILKPYLECAPANVAEDANDTVHNPYEHLTCYKAKDVRDSNPPPDAPPDTVTVRNFVDDDLDLDLKNGQLLCMPSLADFPGAPTPLPSGTPTLTGTITTTPTVTATATATATATNTS